MMEGLFQGQDNILQSVRFYLRVDNDFIFSIIDYRPSWEGALEVRRKRLIVGCRASGLKYRLKAMNWCIDSCVREEGRSSCRRAR